MAGDSKAIVKKEGGNRKERRANEKSKVDNTHRRTWDKEDYEERAAAREKVRHQILLPVPCCWRCPQRLPTLVRRSNKRRRRVP